MDKSDISIINSLLDYSSINGKEVWSMSSRRRLTELRNTDAMVEKFATAGNNVSLKKIVWKKIAEDLGDDVF